MKTVFQIFKRDVKRLMSNWVAVIVVIGVCLIPSLYAWFNIAANMDPYSNTQGIKIAVANCDEGTDNEATGKLNAGDEIVENLKANDSLGWIFVDEKEAVAGVKAGNYYAAIVIPETFSESLVSILSGDIQSPEIKYYLNEKKNAIAPKVTDTGATTIQQQVNETFVSVASEAVSKMLDESVQEASASAGKVNRKSANAIRNAAAALKKQQDILDDLDDLAASGHTMITGADTTLDRLQETASEGAAAIDDSLDALAAVREAVNTFSFEANAAIMRGNDYLAELQMQAGEDLAAIQVKLSEAEVELRKLIAEQKSVVASNEDITNQLKKLQEEYPTDALQSTITLLEKQNNDYNELLNGMEETLDTLDHGAQVLGNLQTGIAGAIRDEQDGLNLAKNTLTSKVFPVVNATLDTLAVQGGTLSGILTGMEPTIRQLQSVLAGLDNCVSETRGALKTTSGAITKVATKLSGVADEISALKSADAYSEYRKFVKDRGLNSQVVADFISSPVQLTTVSLFPVKNYGSAMTPFYTNLAIWVSGIVLIAIFKMEVDRDEKLKKFTPTQAYFGRWLLFITVGLVQALIICLGNLFLLKTQCEYPLAFIGAGLFTSFVYVNPIYAFSITFKHIGKAIAVILVILQIPGSAGTYPIEMTPDFFQKLHPLLPFTYGINAMREAIAGMYGHNYFKYMGILAVYLPIAFLIGIGVRLLMLNLNRMFDKKLEETGLMICEESGQTRERVQLSTAINILADQGEFRSKMIEKAEKFEANYQKWTKLGFLLILLLPTVFLVLMFSVSSKMVFLVLWIIAIIAVILFLIILEFIHENLQRKLQYSDQTKEEFLNDLKGDAKS